MRRPYRGGVRPLDLHRAPPGAVDSRRSIVGVVATYGLVVRWGLSVSLSGELDEPASVARLATVAEDVGWDGVFVWDHLWNRTAAPFADPFVTLAAIAAATRRVRIGTMVAALPRRRPQLIAQAATSLDRLSDGRMVLGLGLGVDSYGEYSVFGEPADDDRARGRALDAGITALLPMLAGQPVPGAAGRTTTAPGVRQPRLPIWIAGRTGRRAGPRRVARHALEGLALVDADVWSAQHVTDALAAGALAPGRVDVVLVGGSHPDPDALAPAGTTWCMAEFLPGATLAEAMDMARTGPA
jgi:alkanesulfonate monooxygenase SsuD/methylene tetrahydromethanopterin reductase-like flavin-dependent oxidoreductase (luciferase family)